jgi:hypothetical protein
MAFLQDFHEGVASLDGLNRAFITLIPKKDEVLTADGFRPISLQNCVMKIVTRILTTRLQHFIERLISFEQSGFVKGRNIVDNFLYAADVIQSCRTRNTPAVVLKLDFKKAFDSVNWTALDAILDARGVGPLFRSWVSSILTTGRTAILLNGVPGPGAMDYLQKRFTPRRPSIPVPLPRRRRLAPLPHRHGGPRRAPPAPYCG